MKEKRNFSQITANNSFEVDFTLSNASNWLKRESRQVVRLTVGKKICQVIFWVFFIQLENENLFLIKIYRRPNVWRTQKYFIAEFILKFEHPQGLTTDGVLCYTWISLQA